MGLLDNIVGTYQDIKNVAGIIKNTRSLSVLKTLVENINSYREPDFFDITGSSYVSTASDIVGLYDNKISPLDIYDMVHRDTYYPGLFEQLIETLFSKPYFVSVKKDANGKLLGDEKQAKYYEGLLGAIDYEDIVEKLVYALRAEGGGNALLFTSWNEGKLEIRIEPFLDFGRPRVKVYGDNRTKKIYRYEVVDWRFQPVYTIIPKENYYMHVRYSRAGDYRFSRNPAKRAVYWYILKKYIAGSNLASFKNGMQDTVFMTPDYTQLKSAMDLLSSGSKAVGDSARQKFLDNPLEYFQSLRQIDRVTLQDIAGRARDNNKAVSLSTPMTFEKVSRTNKEMDTVKLIALCDQQIGYALRTSRGLINTSDSKYDNAEIESDNWSNLVVDPLKRQIERITEKFILPALDINFDPNMYSVRFGRDVDAEDIELFNAKTTRNTSKASMFSQMAAVPGFTMVPFTYNLDTDEFVKISQIQANEQSEKNETAEDMVDDEIENVEDLARSKTRAKRVTTSELALKSPEADKFHNVVKNTIKKQVTDYATKLNKRKSVKDAINHFDDDFAPINRFGLPVAVYKQQLMKFAKKGIQEFHDSTSKKRADDFEFPSNVLDMLDAKAQMMIKGFGSLDDKQQEMLSQFYRGKSSRDSLKNYAGIDQETSDQINTMLQNALGTTDSENPVDIQDLVDQIMGMADSLSEGRARRIVNTEIAQTVEATRMNVYQNDGFDEKQWVGVHDDRERTEHWDNEAQGFIGIDEPFQSGDYSPADAYECRCSLVFRRSSDNSEGDEE